LEAATKSRAIPVGNDFANLSLPRYRNITEFYPQPDRLYGTDTLCGDYNGRLLVLGQDFSNVETIEKRLTEAPGENPFHHGLESTTNKNLVEFLRPKYEIDLNCTIDQARACGVLYGNLIWLLKETPTLSDRLPSPKAALKVSEPVFRATVNAMPNLERIFCLGRVCYEGLAFLEADRGNKLAKRRSWRTDLEHRQFFWLNDRKVAICPLPHPGSLGVLNRGGPDQVKGDFAHYLNPPFR